MAAEDDFLGEESKVFRGGLVTNLEDLVGILKWFFPEFWISTKINKRDFEHTTSSKKIYAGLFLKSGLLLFCAKALPSVRLRERCSSPFGKTNQRFYYECFWLAFTTIVFLWILKVPKFPKLLPFLWTCLWQVRNAFLGTIYRCNRWRRWHKTFLLFDGISVHILKIDIIGFRLFRCIFFLFVCQFRSLSRFVQNRCFYPSVTGFVCSRSWRRWCRREIC